MVFSSEQKRNRLFRPYMETDIVSVVCLPGGRVVVVGRVGLWRVCRGRRGGWHGRPRPPWCARAAAAVDRFPHRPVRALVRHH